MKTISRKALSALLLCGLAQAEPPPGINVCTDAEGHTVYQQLPCDSDLPIVGAESSQVAIKTKPAPDRPRQSNIEQARKQHYVDARVACTLLIESMAAYSYRWTDGTFTPARFERAKWLAGSDSVMIWSGNQLELMNGLGSWLPHRYDCSYDTSSRQALSADVWPGI